MLGQLRGFQSLFFWIHFYDGRRYSRVPRLLIRFNPCFSGFTSTTSCTHSESHRFTRFNPCFSGFTSTTAELQYKASMDRGFQSLFFWIHFYDIFRNFGCPPHGPSFNPCFSGFTSTTGDGGCARSKRTSRFNPCFSGFTSTTDACVSPTAKNFSFNPCFSGFTSTTDACVSPTAKNFSFNPCFSGFTSTTSELTP